MEYALLSEQLDWCVSHAGQLCNYTKVCVVQEEPCDPYEVTGVVYNVNLLTKQVVIQVYGRVRRHLKSAWIYNCYEVRVEEHRWHFAILPREGPVVEVVLQISDALALEPLKSWVEKYCVRVAAVNSPVIRREEGLRQRAVDDLDWSAYYIFENKVVAKPLRLVVLQVVSNYFSVNHVLIRTVLNWVNLGYCRNVVHINRLRASGRLLVISHRSDYAELDTVGCLLEDLLLVIACYLCKCSVYAHFVALNRVRIVGSHYVDHLAAQSLKAFLETSHDYRKLRHPGTR